MNNERIEIMKRILIVSSCGKRRNTIGLIGELLSALSEVDHSKYHISLLDTNFFELNHNPSDYPVDEYISLNDSFIDKIMRNVPHYRSLYANRKAVQSYKRLFKKNHYDIVIIYQIPSYSDELVSIAHLNGAKVVFEPFGSDILRASGEGKRRLMKAFTEVDCVCGRDKSGTINAAINDYNVPLEKLRLQNFYSEGIKRLIEVRGKKTRREMLEDIGIEYSDYNIVCGYSGREAHRHRAIIESLIKVKDVLPEGYQIIFPMTYGAGTHHETIISYAAQLKEICDREGLHTVFLTDFMSNEQVAYLHLITDLFIEIQPTDNGNGFMIEAIFAENQIVTGRWLKYDRFEQYGVPYHLIDRPEELPQVLRKIFCHQIMKPAIPEKLLRSMGAVGGQVRSAFWEQLFESLN